MKKSLGTGDSKAKVFNKSLSQLHGYVPSLPDNGAQIAHLEGVAHNVNVLALWRDGIGFVTDRDNNAVSGNVEALAILVNDSYAVLANLACAGLKMHGNLVRVEEVTQEACVGKADFVGNDKIVLHLDYSRLLALEIQVISDFAAGQTAADNNHIVADFLFAQQIFNSLDSVLGTLDGKFVGNRTCGNDNLVGVERIDVFYL